MSNIRANITELLQILDIMPAEQNIMLVGNHGICVDCGEKVY